MKTTTAELWTAILTVEEDEEFAKREKRRIIQDRSLLHTSLNQEIKAIELMLLGSPDYPTPDLNIDLQFKINAPVPTHNHTTYQVLPSSIDRKRLVELYIKYKLLARTDKLMFSPLGISSFIELKNTKIDTTTKFDNPIYSWKQLISFGRDEEVEIVELIIDKEFGHKYLHIKSTKRRTRKGISFLEYREYVMPLDKLINYESHINDRDAITGNVLVSKFQSPFSTVEIKELKPKRIVPLGNNWTTLGIANYRKDFTGYSYIDPNDKTGQNILTNGTSTVYYPIDFYSLVPVTFEYEAIDWQGQKVKFNKHIQALQESFNYALKSVSGTKFTLDDINNFFDGGNLGQFYYNLATIKDKIKDSNDKIKDQWSKYYQRNIALIKIVEHKYLKDIRTLAKNSNFVIDSLPGLKSFIEKLKEAHSEIKNSSTELIFSSSLFGKLTTDEIYKLKTDFSAVVNQINIAIQIKYTKIEDLIQLNAILVNEIKKISSVDYLYSVFSKTNLYEEMYKGNILLSELIDYGNQLRFGVNTANDLLDISAQVAAMPDIDDFHNIIDRQLLNTIDIYQQKIAFTAKNIENEFEEIKEDTISNLHTEYLLFRGKLTTLEDKSIAFFEQYSSIAQLERAQTYVDSLNKIVNEQIPVTFKYAKEYVNSQVETIKFDVEKNAAKVYAEVTLASQDYLKGQLRKVAAEMGGYINPEMPVEYLTYLKDPKKLSSSISKELRQSIPHELSAMYKDTKDAYNDLVFISGQAKDAWNEARQIRPEDFFKNLEAKILGSIELKDILGFDFELPRMSVVKSESGIPEKIVYNFVTDKIREMDIGTVKFYAKNKGKRSFFQVYMEKGITSPKQYNSFTKLENFSIGLKPFGPEILTILFSKLEVSASNRGSKKTHVEIDDIKFGGPLDFVGKLAESLKIPDTGLRIKPSLKEIEIGYLYTMPSIETPSFNLANLKFDLGLNIPLPNPLSKSPPEELITTFSINRPEDKFLVTAGIFGGRGYFVIQATPKKLVNIDASMEYGGYFGINLGIAKGFVFLFFGLRFQSRQINGINDVQLTAYIICSGGVTVFGYISVSVTFLLLLNYNIKSNVLFGSASVSYSIKIGFFKKSFTLRYSKTLVGSKGKKIDPNTEQITFVGEFQKEEILYASIDDNFIFEKNVDLVDNQISEAKGDKADFDEIYNFENFSAYFYSFNR
ncbi:MAG TPA: hypothetical protein VF465_08510 [Flavobacterium sp.]|uniref:hypothetical protein n=1 Tax=Flavobacterium sp. TaxID=239 RepID=UPI002ED1DB1D